MLNAADIYITQVDLQCFKYVGLCMYHTKIVVSLRGDNPEKGEACTRLEAQNYVQLLLRRGRQCYKLREKGLMAFRLLTRMRSDNLLVTSSCSQERLAHTLQAAA